MRAKARLLCKSNQIALPRIGIPPCVQAPRMRTAARKRAPFPRRREAGGARTGRRASKPGEAGNAWTFCPLPSYTARIRDTPGSDAARMKSPPEPTVPALRDAFMNRREGAGERRKAAGGPEADHPSAPTFQAGAEWVRRVLVPAIERANTELQPVDVAFKLDLNLDPRSTNHAHADFWLSELGEGQRAVGPKYSINVLGGQNVWLYKPGVPGRDLGNVDRYGLDEIEMLLQDAAEEFGMMAR